MTYKPSKLGRTDLIFVCDQSSSFIIRPVRAALQVITFSGYDLCQPH